MGGGGAAKAQRFREAALPIAHAAPRLAVSGQADRPDVSE